MTRQRSMRRGRGGRRAGRSGSEWIGGLLSPPFFATDREEPYRPGLVVWMDAREGLVVGQEVVDPDDAEGAVARTLLSAMERPLAGPPRRPARIRVASEQLAAQLRQALGDATPIRVAATPELDELLQLMLESIQQERESGSYLEDGRILPEAVAELFAAAQILYDLAPWKVATDDQVLRMDIPALGVDGACVSIIGNLGESLGLMIFPSLAGYEAFLAAAEEHARSGGWVDLGTEWIALNFERGADLPAEMRREVASHGWPVADANAYPRVGHIERDGAPRPLVEADVRIASACAASFCALWAQHRDLFEGEAFEPVCESYFDARDLEVRFTAPYEAFELFDVAGSSPDGPAARSAVGRNDPCPCGSGRKYKGCHLAADEAERAAADEAALENDLEARLVSELCEYAMLRFGEAWQCFGEDFADVTEALQLAVPWSVYQYQVEGCSVLEWYLEERSARLEPAERAWLEAQRASWLSVWEVLEVEPGQNIAVRDLLSLEERCVREVSGSRTLVARDALLARVVNCEGESTLCGVHPRPLPPVEAADVVRRARGRLRRRRAVPVERLRDEPFGRYLIKRWEEAVDELDLRAAIPPRIQNTDGDALLLTTDHFALEAAARSEVEVRLAAMEGVDADDPDEPERVFVFLVPGNAQHPDWANTVVGRACLSQSSLRVETNSRERADALRARIEEACRGLLRHRAREHSDPLSEAVRGELPPAPPEAPSPEARQLVLDVKRRHYAEWPDVVLPALGHLTPREAVRTARGRGAVDVLLKDMENRERRSAGEDAFDFGDLRRELRLD